MSQDDDDDDNIAAQLSAKFRKTDRSVVGRAARESQPKSRAARRGLVGKQSERTVSVYFRCTPTFKNRLVALSMRDGITQTELIERGIGLYDEGGQK